MSRRRSLHLGIGLTLVLLLAAAVVVSYLWLPFAPDDTSGGRLSPPGDGHLLGTDKLGRDLFTQLLLGGRIAFATGIGAVAVGSLLGVSFGLLAGFATRWLDDAAAVALDILIAFPTLLLAMIIVAGAGASLGAAILAIGIGMAAIVARLTRVLVKQVLAREYITAARVAGISWPRIVASHILPNIAPTLMVNLALQAGLAVLAEASLSYLGLGTPPPNASWGRMLFEAQATALTAPVAALAPGIALVALVIGLNLTADGLRDLTDPTRRRARTATSPASSTSPATTPETAATPASEPAAATAASATAAATATASAAASAAERDISPRRAAGADGVAEPSDPTGRSER
ncbi:ABC transporter permease [Actinoplanes sp. Pm04-4]|uniref:ABC transporter permease n=1 Tax=Paractinoplanes pyxinae TaxID=2997416 RepID=A0ABT4BD59_9ACTN|nr:ABC transporter permease [Actinoplanes pyxinae]MCY1144457.1 ABC transporter permease [Actinoplanes pyxinae]